MKNKKLLFVSGLTLTFVAATLLIGLKAGASEPVITTADDDPVTYIAMSESAFSNWDATAGEFADNSARYWGDKSFNALDTFFRGETGSKSETTLLLKPWTQKTQYVYFQWGGAGQNDGKVYLKFHCGSKEYTMLNTTEVGNPLMLKYFVVPAEDYAELMTANPGGFQMSIDLVDEVAGTGGYGFHSFGYLHPNQTKESTADAMRYYLNEIDDINCEDNMPKTILGHYYGNSYLRDVFYSPVSNIDEDFESQDLFLKHWYFDHSYLDKGNGEARHINNVISNVDVRPGDTNLPFNKTGTSFFRGWYESSIDQGYVAHDTQRYRLISRPITLSNSETTFVKVKMGGTASLHVIDATVEPGTNQNADLAWINNKVYNTSGDWILTRGFNSCTMTRHIINLEAYKGRTVQFAIADISSGGWGAAYFDEFKVGVDLTTDGLNLEVVSQQWGEEPTYYAVFADKYVCSTHIESDDNGIIYKNGADGVTDESAEYAASQFVSSFLGYARDNARGTEVCSVRTSKEMKALLETYDGLSERAKRIVCASDDYQRYGATSENWENTAVTLLELGHSIAYLAEENGVNVTVYGVSYRHVVNNVLQSVNSGTLAIVIVIGGAAILAVAVLALLKKRKQN